MHKHSAEKSAWFPSSACDTSPFPLQSYNLYTAVIRLKYCGYGVKHQTIIQSVNICLDASALKTHRIVCKTETDIFFFLVFWLHYLCVLIVSLLQPIAFILFFQCRLFCLSFAHVTFSSHLDIYFIFIFILFCIVLMCLICNIFITDCCW